MSDFMERARAASHNPYSTPAGLGSAISRFDEDMRIAFLAGAEWARRVLLADPTEAEVEAVAEVLVTERYLMRAVSLESARKDAVMWRADVEFLRPQARAVIAAFLGARRGSE